MVRRPKKSAPPPGETHEPARLVSLQLGGRRAFIVDLPDAALPMPDGLTEAECEIVVLLLQGLSNGEIAKLRARSYRTVANQLAAIYRKTGVASRAELVARLGWNDLEDDAGS